MNWIHFLIWLAGLYISYYLVVVLTDSALRGKTASGPASNELTFSEDISPKSIEHLPDKPLITEPKPAPAIIASGGVSLKNLFGLAREEAIIYTKAVSF
jgi:hypothetical protein